MPRKSRCSDPDAAEYRPATLPLRPETRLPREPRTKGQTAVHKATQRPVSDRWYLVNSEGRYLHYSGKNEFVRDVKYAWWGITAQVKCMKERNPEFANLREVPFDGV